MWGYFNLAVAGMTQAKELLKVKRLNGLEAWRRIVVPVKPRSDNIPVDAATTRFAAVEVAQSPWMLLFFHTPDYIPRLTCCSMPVHVLIEKKQTRGYPTSKRIF